MTKLITQKPLTTALTGRTLSECHCFLNILTFFHNGLFCFLARLYPRKRVVGCNSRYNAILKGVFFLSRFFNEYFNHSGTKLGTVSKKLL